jgi:hypothetical protein
VINCPCRESVKASQPGLTVSQAAKELGRRWALLGPEDRVGYQAMADQAKLRYNEEMAAYQAGRDGIV